MKKHLFLSFILTLGVFIMVDTPLLAQTSDTKSSKSESESSSSRASSRSAYRSARSIDRSSGVYVTAPDVEFRELQDGFAYTMSSSGDNNSRLSLSKRYSGQSTNKEGTFSIEEGVKKLKLSISGTVEVGKISLELYLPGRKVLKRLTIDDSADISWSQNISIPEGETKYYGTWTYVIKAESVEGRYNMSISSY